MTDRDDYTRANKRDLALAALAFYDKEYYGDLVIAIRSKNAEEFQKIVKKAGMSPEQAERLWDLLNRTYPDVLW